MYDAVKQLSIACERRNMSFATFIAEAWDEWPTKSEPDLMTKDQAVASAVSDVQNHGIVAHWVIIEVESTLK